MKKTTETGESPTHLIDEKALQALLCAAVAMNVARRPKKKT